MSIKSIHADTLEGDKEMKEKEHLPVIGVGPVYVVIIILCTVVGIVLSEKWLYNLYGEEYAPYCKKVNRCIPWFKKI